MTKKDPVHLSETQLELMRVLWKRGEADTKTVCEDLEKPLAYTTVATLLKRLENRGAVEARSEDRRHIYRPLVTEDEVMTSMVSSLIGTLFKGDSSALVSHLVKKEEVSEDDLEKISEIIKKGQKS